MARPGGWVDPQHLMPKPDYAYEIDTPFQSEGLREQVLGAQEQAENEEEDVSETDPTTMQVMRPLLDKIGDAANASMVATRPSDAEAADQALIQAYDAALEKAMSLLGVAETGWLNASELREGDTITQIHHTGITWRFRVKQRLGESSAPEA